MPPMTLRWTVSGYGWADCVVADGDAWIEVTASYISPAPEDLLNAVTALLLGTTETRAEFNAEPAVFRWIFKRDQYQVTIQILEVDDDGLPDSLEREIWRSRQAISELAQAVAGEFGRVLTELGDDKYLRGWFWPFPHAELERLRAAMRRFA